MLQQYPKVHQLGRIKESSGKHGEHRACVLFTVRALEVWECGNRDAVYYTLFQQNL